ncbi:hypothetical protein BZA05DRAFT_389219 [Tricharina praecox]|uniref:uncharacterized protein n=1 Tax=Tricharina praecox TaxID=43433 RepID=UPI0022200F54|nr:uncharacterized protein BZA05DRAFT_389219 [Tricharina praecox]KAI5855646.1 hypothetical protein BZA05DRAFT_389219 [Tricharina praecox]
MTPPATHSCPSPQPHDARHTTSPSHPLAARYHSPAVRGCLTYMLCGAPYFHRSRPDSVTDRSGPCTRASFERAVPPRVVPRKLCRKLSAANYASGGDTPDGAPYSQSFDRRINGEPSQRCFGMGKCSNLPPSLSWDEDAFRSFVQIGMLRFVRQARQGWRVDHVCIVPVGRRRRRRRRDLNWLVCLDRLSCVLWTIRCYAGGHIRC